MTLKRKLIFNKGLQATFALNENNIWKRNSVEEVEEGNKLQPKFDEKGLIPAITVENDTKEILMHGYMNEEALKLTIETKYAHYWSRSRRSIWKKGEKVGFIKK